MERNKNKQLCVPKDDDFMDILFSWSLADIFDENLYKDQVEKIPETFQSVGQYLGSFEYPLLEETHAKLASAFETAYGAPFAEVTGISKRDRLGERGRLVYNIEVDHWMNKTRERDVAPYKTLPGDVLLITTKKPENDDDIHRDAWMYFLASVIWIVDDGDSDDEGGDASTSSGFIVETVADIDIENLQSKSLFVIYMTSMITNKRIWRALHMYSNLTVINRILCKDDLVEESCDRCPYISYREMEDKIGSSLLSKLNESQKDAILATMCKTECDHKASVELIWGPPGTGKTAILSNLLCALLRMGVKTLICAPTNVAITELASRVVKLFSNSVNDESTECFSTLPLGDMLIFGNQDRLKIGEDIEEIFLDHRLRMLANCVLPATGWRQSIMSMVNFLDNVVSLHEVYVENELQIKEKEGLSDDFCSSHPKSLLEFARERYAHLTTNLRRSMTTLSTHLPRSYILEDNVQSIMQLMSLLNFMEKLLFEDGSMTSEALKNAFLQKEMEGSEELVNPTSLVSIRSQCASILRSLQASLSRIVTNQISTKEFCFEKAQLIFCTISSSFKLHHLVDMEPFKLLVIDEAAQVKECESTIALQIHEVRHTILVGDECQLPATVISTVAEKAGFGRSLFERLSSLGHYKHLLNIQYRMHPSISHFPNANFYCNQISNAQSVQSKSYERFYLKGRMFGPYSFINIRGGREEIDDAGKSKRNLVEAAVAVKLVHMVFKAWKSRCPREKLSIGVISPYSAQVVSILDMIHKKYANVDGFAVKVMSVDGFQGGEEDIIIISTVRSNSSGSIGFLSSLQRTNVALTRARHCLWILGNERTLCKTYSVWEALVKDAQHRQCFFTADEDHDLEKAIVDVKKELEELDDLLSADSMLFQNLRWKVVFSDNFRRSFQQLKLSNVKKLAVNLLRKLANGWRPKAINVDSQCQNSLHVVKQFKFKEYYIICTVDIIKDSMYKQVLKVWDVLPMGEAPKLLKRLDGVFAMFTDDFISHCNEKVFERALEVPKSWPVTKDIIRYKNQNDNVSSSVTSNGADECRSYVENSKVNESLLLMKFYSLSTGTVNHLLSDLEGREVDLPFEVTDEEREIISFPRSSFILGRSGTGKTTILTMKLFQKLQQYCIASKDTNMNHIGDKVGASDCTGTSQESMLRQLFVTVSPKLCHAVRKHVSRLKRFATGNFMDDISTDMDDIDEMAEFKDIPDTFVGIKPEKYPLIITLNKFLMMLDGTLGNSYFERFRDARCSTQKEGIRSVSLETFIRNNEVTYDRFWSSYWPHFNSNVAKILDPSRVFTEIMSHIKGGLQDGEESDNKKSRLAYISLSDCRVSTLSAERRDMIYDIFEDYEKMKMERRQFDLADFVLDVHHRVKDGNLPGDKMDFVYIDEVQDFAMKQICLFSHICENVDEGFVFSGDTAQTIARGIDFRFEDIRSLFYNEFFGKSRRSQSLARREKGVISDVVSLSQNFRTHIGVLRLAQSVTDLISYFFPQSIDILTPETSLIFGEPPIFLEPGSDENSIISIFCNSASAGENWVGFGADQVILVRDDFEKKEISNYLGYKALILTIVECKGLEFQDVLLYNFFGSSPMSNHWRVVYEFLKEKGLDATTPKSFPTFSMSRHNILCSELKQLYVAITRTRQRLWICENNEEISKPMLDYWKSLCLVQVRKLDDSLAQAMQRASSPEEWKTQGMKLFWEKNYEMATMCFERAGEETWEKRAKASGLRATAYSLKDSNPVNAHTMLREAAEIFDSIGRADSAAGCFCDLGEYERAGRIYLDKCGMSELRKAGECFCLAGIYEMAAQVFAKGNFFDECLSACTRGHLFDLGLQYIESWKQDALWNSLIMERLDEIKRIAQEFLEKCALECHARNDKATLMKFVRAFHTMESKRNFLKGLNCLEEVLILEEDSGNYIEAAEIAKHLGNIQHEVDLLDKAGCFEDASSLLLYDVLSNSLWVSGHQHWPLTPFSRKEELLDKAITTAQKVSDTFHLFVCAEAGILSDKQRTLSELMQCYMVSKKFGTYVGEVLSIRKLLDVHCKFHPANFEWETKVYVHQSALVERILRNRVSGATLFYVWNLWKEKNLEILECLDTLGNMDFIECKGVVRFCLNYFGLRLQDKFKGKFILPNRNASWFKNFDLRFVVQSGKLVILDARHFAPVARKHWQQEFLSVGVVVLEALKSLYKHSQDKRMSKDLQSVLLTYIYDIAKFFIVSKSLDVNTWKFQDYVMLSSTDHFENAFPLDTRESLSEDMICLRETQLSRNLLGETISMNIANSRNDLTYGQIGRVAMVLLGLGIPNQDVCAVIAKGFCESPSSWKPFIENLVQIIGLLDKDGSGALDSLSYELYRAIEETYNANWRARDYISPRCFFYLVERLLIFLPHSHGFFFATKSSFTEYLLSLDSVANPCSMLCTKESPHTISVVNFVCGLVQQCLNDTKTTADWIKASCINCKFYFPVLLLRLFVILCLLSLNSDVNFIILSKLLRAPYIRQQLPRQFVDVLCSGRRSDKPYVAAVVARAFKVVGDPLMVVAITGSSPTSLCPGDAISVDLRSLASRDEVIRTLYPRSFNTPSSDHVTNSDVQPQLPLVGSNQGATNGVSVVQSKSDVSDGVTTSDNQKGVLQVNWVLIVEMIYAIDTFLKADDGGWMDFISRKKVELEKHMHNLMAHLSEQWHSHGNDGNEVLHDTTCIIGELMQQLPLLDTREVDYTKAALLEIGLALGKLVRRQPEFDNIMRLHLQVPRDNAIDEATTSQSLEVENEDEDEEGDKSSSVVVGEELPVPVPVPAEVSQSNNNNNNKDNTNSSSNNNKKKNKGKKGGRKKR